MTESYQIRVDISLVNLLDEMQKELKKEIKQKYNLDEVDLYGTFASAVLAAKLKGRKVYFKIKKSGKNKGIIELNNNGLAQ